MKGWISAVFILMLGAGLVLFTGCSTASHDRSEDSVKDHDLAGTAWRLIQFRAVDSRNYIPNRPSDYTLRFEADGKLQMQVDCNTGQGSWSSPARGQLVLSQLMTTRKMCPPGSLHQIFTHNLERVRSYRFQGERLYLSLPSDGGTYEFEAEPR